MHRMLDLRRLRYFLAIAEHGSISGAARTLNVAQPALSYHIAEMERLSGLRLLNRSRGGVQLTLEGEILHRHAVEIVQRTDLAEAALGALSRKNAPLQRFRVAIITSLAAELTPLLVGRLQEGERTPMLSIMEAGTRDIETRLVKGRIDFAVCLTPSPSIDAEPIASEELVFVAPQGVTQKTRLSLGELAYHGLVLPARGNPLRDFIEEVAANQGFSLDVVLEVDGASSRYNAVVNRIGCTLLGAYTIPASAVKSGLCVVPIKEPGLRRPIFLGRRKGLDQGHADAMRSLIAAALVDLGLSPPTGTQPSAMF